MDSPPDSTFVVKYTHIFIGLHGFGGGKSDYELKKNLIIFKAL